MNIHEELSVFNKVKYYDEPHIYIIGNQELISGTSFVGLFKQKFDRAGQAKKYAKKNRLNIEDVLNDWDFKGEISRTKGTLLHKFAEEYWLNKVFPLDLAPYEERLPDITHRFERCKEMFLEYYQKASQSLCPVSLELVVGDEELGIGGMVDKLVYNKYTKSYEIWDYKTNKEIASESAYRKKMLAPINFLDDCELNAYSLQLSLYKYIIEKNTKIKIGKMWLVHIHEDQPSYNIIQCHDFTDYVDLMIKWHNRRK